MVFINNLIKAVSVMDLGKGFCNCPITVTEINISEEIDRKLSTAIDFLRFRTPQFPVWDYIVMVLTCSPTGKRGTSF